MAVPQQAGMAHSSTMQRWEQHLNAHQNISASIQCIQKMSKRFLAAPATGPFRLVSTITSHAPP
eukprot:1161084-Pelagomonas_calceolata.AAC.13